MILLLTSIIGFGLYLICFNLFYISKSHINTILLIITSIIPIVGVLKFLWVLMNGVQYHTHPLNTDTSLGYKIKWFYNALKVRDTKLNRWLFNDINWKEYDMLKNDFNKSNTI